MIQFVWWSFAMALTPLALGLGWRLATALFAWLNPDLNRPTQAATPRMHVQPLSCSLSSSSISISGLRSLPKSRGM
jgi:hypothetical protein